MNNSTAVPRRRWLVWGTLAWIGANVLSAHAYQVTLLSAASVYDPNPAILDTNLGFPSQNLHVEVFEDQTLIPEIKTNIKGHQTDDTEGGTSAWDGQWPSSPCENETTFDVRLSGVRTFGIGLGNNDSSGKEQLFINSGEGISLATLPGYATNSQGRAFYLKVQAEPNDADIRTVRISKCSRMRFDHLVLECDGGVAGNRLPEASLVGLGVPKATDAPDMVRVSVDMESRNSTVAHLETPPSPEAWKRGVELLSTGGRRYVGDQFRFFFIDPEGTVTTSKPQWISLYNTEGKLFRLHGQVWLGGRCEALLFPGDLPDGFALFLREWDGTQRYSLTSRGAEVKRRLYHGKPSTELTNVTRFVQPSLGNWIAFYIDVSWDRIVFFLGDQAAVIDGPLDMDGANKIAIAPNTKLKDLRLEIFDRP